MLHDDQCAFLGRQTVHHLLRAQSAGEMYGLTNSHVRPREAETGAANSKGDSVSTASERSALLPCFVICRKLASACPGADAENVATFAWTHSRWRRQGLASTLVRLLNIHSAAQILSESASFWEACQVAPFGFPTASSPGPTASGLWLLYQSRRVSTIR